MPEEKRKTYDELIVEHYSSMIQKKFPEHYRLWPIISGYDLKHCAYKGWTILIYLHSGRKGIKLSSSCGELPSSLIGVNSLDHNNKNAVRVTLQRHFELKPTDAIVFVEANSVKEDEFQLMLHKHKFSMGMKPMKIFLSHKGADKPLVRDYKQTLELLGYEPWLDEDSMQAGAELERSLLKGFNDSCAAVFFVTTNYVDDNYLATEIEYAIQEKRKKGDMFSIIALRLGEGEQRGIVPDLLHRYVWKEPKTNMEALRVIIKALPVKTGDVYWKM